MRCLSNVRRGSAIWTYLCQSTNDTAVVGVACKYTFRRRYTRRPGSPRRLGPLRGRGTTPAPRPQPRPERLACRAALGGDGAGRRGVRRRVHDGQRERVRAVGRRRLGAAGRPAGRGGVRGRGTLLEPVRAGSVDCLPLHDERAGGNRQLVDDNTATYVEEMSRAVFGNNRQFFFFFNDCQQSTVHVPKG